MNKLLVILALITLSSCFSEPLQTKPKIPDDQLVEILKDVHIAEAAILNLPKEQRDSLALRYYSEIFRIHQVSKEDFDQSLKVLLVNPRLSEALYKRVSDRLAEEGAAQ